MTADTVGGVWSYSVDLIREFAKSGIEVLLATMGGPLNAAQQAEISGCRNLKLEASNFKLEWMQEPWEEVQAAGQWLLALEREFEPDLIHLNGYAHGALPWLAPKIVVGHSCVLSWWQAVHGVDAPEEYSTYRGTVQEGIRAADAVVAPSHAMMRSLREHYGPFDGKKTVVIPNGRVPGEYRARNKENFILSAGRLWDEAKNVRAVCACSTKVPWKICVAGETKHPDGQCAEFPDVKSLGYLTPASMKEVYARAAIYALPAKYEPFGLSILEAGLSGCALVLGDIPSLRENWDGAALFVAPDDGGEIETGLRRLIQNPNELERLGQLASARGRKYRSEVSARKYLELYSDLLITPAGKEFHGVAERGTLLTA